MMRAVGKYTALTVLMILFAMVAAACSNGGGGDGGGDGGGTSNTPDSAARAWFEGALAGNAEVVRNNTCAANADEADMIAEQMGAAMTGAEGVEVDYSGLTYTTTEENGDNATVSISGNMSVTVQGQTVDSPVGEDLSFPLVREDGAWKVCDTAG